MMDRLQPDNECFQMNDPRRANRIRRPWAIGNLGRAYVNAELSLGLERGSATYCRWRCRLPWLLMIDGTPGIAAPLVKPTDERRRSSGRGILVEWFSDATACLLRQCARRAALADRPVVASDCDATHNLGGGIGRIWYCGVHADRTASGSY